MFCTTTERYLIEFISYCLLMSEIIYRNTVNFPIVFSYLPTYVMLKTFQIMLTLCNYQVKVKQTSCSLVIAVRFKNIYLFTL